MRQNLRHGIVRPKSLVSKATSGIFVLPPK